MNYLKLKENIEKAIHAHPMEVEPYNDFFDLCREYEKIDFAVAHEWNHNMRVYIGWALRSAVERADFTAAERFDNLLFRSLLFGAPHFFDDYLQAVEYGKPLDKKFYQPRRHYLKRYVDAYQEILDGKLDFLSISMPKRAGKSQLGINFTNMLSGKYPDRSTLMEGTGDDLVKSFYLGCLEYLQTPSDYHFYDIFPESKLVQTNADTKIINLTQKHIRGRLAESLLLLADNYGYEADGATLKIYMSREDLANLSNMTTSNAIRTLTSFVSEKLILVDGRRIRIVNEAQLRKISKFG